MKSKCPFPTLDLCMALNKKASNKALIKEHGQWHGDWGKGSPQLNWIVGWGQIDIDE